MDWAGPPVSVEGRRWWPRHFLCALLGRPSYFVLAALIAVQAVTIAQRPPWSKSASPDGVLLPVGDGLSATIARPYVAFSLAVRSTPSEIEESPYPRLPTPGSANSFQQAVDVVAASITALRSGEAAPAVVWAPERRCRWTLRLAVPASAPAAVALLSSFRWVPSPDHVRHGVAGTIVMIEGAGTDLAEVMAGLGPRPVRLMAWAANPTGVSGEHGGDGWVRITVDDLSYLAGRLDPDLDETSRWTLCLSSPIPMPLVEVLDLPNAN